MGQFESRLVLSPERTRLRRVDKTVRRSLLKDRFKALGGVSFPRSTRTKPKDAVRPPRGFNHWTPSINTERPDPKWVRVQIRTQPSLRVTPAMSAGIATRLWEISDIVGLLDEPKELAA